VVFEVLAGGGKGLVEDTLVGRVLLIVSFDAVAFVGVAVGLDGEVSSGTALVVSVP
jgi:hypothetical protein